MSIPLSERTIVHVLRHRVADRPDQPWLVFEDRAVTYREADRLANRLARGMEAQGIAAGDTLLTMLPDGLDLVVAWLACAKLGVVEVPVNTAYRGDILAHVIKDSRAGSMLIGERWLDRVAALGGDVGALRRCFACPQDGAQPASLAALETFKLDSLYGGDDRPIERAVQPGDLKAIMYTSGTTGKSKGVMVSHVHAYEYANGCASVIEIGADDIYYTAGLPLFHVAGKWGVLLGAAIKGATAIVPRQFSASNFWADIRRHRATATYLLGAMANFLQRQPRRADDSDHSLRKILMCPLLADLDDFIARFGVRVATAYGSTEVNAPLAMPLGSKVRHHQIVGKVRSDLFEVAIIDDDDRAVAAGLTGQIAVRPKVPGVTMLGYWQQPEATVAMWRNLWLHSGDAGHQDGDGNFHFTDRLRDTIRRRGENISSMEVEGIIAQHPDVAECAVYPVRSEHGEDEVMAALVLKPDRAAGPQQLIDFLEPRMPRFMVPRFLDIVAALPKTPTGKVRKHLLREAGITATAFDRESA
jgi:crotonobetaine/carnitine-CoA ligase